ncbi:putative transmembrane protein [Tieghemostelium lacteum]|uniref:Putative transmembrane protein n=1 Tax=Tieghemostelium lacteum TaxID=361077 RepID=A0A151ZCV6_TIELA|nr:putative transmembrane protein [Tieghemostelium lacteum]|eukprot:KYQ91786.1 putative transmembrane protein [Tieghemostelium lacteum]
MINKTTYNNSILLLIVYLSFYFVTLCNAAAPAVVSSTYQVKQLSDITNTYSFTATIIELNFDQNLYINNVLTSIYNSTNNVKTQSGSNKICVPECELQPASIFYQTGTAVLNCGSGRVYNSNLQPDPIISIPNGLIPLPSVGRDTFLAFSNIIGWTNIDLVSSDPNKLSYLIFNDFIYKSNRMQNAGRVTAEEIASGVCTIILGSGNGNTKQYTNQGGETVTFSTSNFTAKPQISLVVQDTTIMNTYFQNQINSLQKADSLAVLGFRSFGSSVLSNSDTWLVGLELIQNYIDLTNAQKPSTFSTDLCGKSLNNPSYSTDPCCNSTLLWTQCCADRDLTIYSPILTRSQQFTPLLSDCKNPQKANETLLNLISTVASSQNPISGCTSTYFNSVKKSLLSELTTFISDCEVAIYGIHKSGYPCERNSDCVSNNCNSVIKSCEYPDDQDQLNDLFITCHVLKMSSFVKSFLADQWKTPTSPTDFKALYKQKVIVQNCVGATADQYTQIKTSTGYQYVIANKTQCLSDESCQFSTRIPNQQECTPGGYCVIDRQFVDSITFPEYCYYPYVDEAGCASVSGTWDPKLLQYNCKLLDYTTEDECLPPTICPIVEVYPSYNKKRCREPFCYRPGITTQATCNSPGDTWMGSYNSGQGLCWTKDSKSVCLSDGNKNYWDGRGFITGSRQDSQQCAKPLCRTGDYLWLDRDQSCQSFSFCTQPATLCYSGITKCYNYSLPGACSLSGGQPASGNGVQKCYFTLQGDVVDIYNQCKLLKNTTFVSCSDLTSTQCQICKNNEPGCAVDYQDMQCEPGWRNDPYTLDLCNRYAGSCSDNYWYIDGIENSGKDCYTRGFTIAPECAGVCLTTFLLTTQGTAYCAEGLSFSPTGCVNFTIFDQTACQATPGYTWQTLSRTKSECETRFSVCHEANGAISAKSQVECQECGGQYKSPFAWDSGFWVNGQNFSDTQWLPNAQWGSTNSWGNSINIATIESSIESALLTKLGPSTQSELLCNYMPYIYTLNAIPCDCSGDPNTPSDCYKSGPTRFLIGVAKVCYGWDDILVSGPMELTIPYNSVPREISCLGIEVAIQPASQFFRENILSTDVLSNSINDYSPSDVVVNEDRVIVGQLIGDGIEVIMTYNTSAQVSPFTQDLTNPMELCIEPRSDISPHFPVMDFATSTDGSNWVPMEANIVVRNGKFCANITRANTFFPIFRIEDWEAARNQPIFTKVQFAFIYLIAVLFTLAIIFSLLSLWNQIRKTGFHLTLPKLINAEIIVFCLVRALYLYLIGKEKIGPNQGNLAAFYLLSELPLYIFLSIFSTLVFFWAELNQNASSRYKSFLSNLRYPFIIANSAMYIMFVIVLSIFHSLNSDQQHTLKIIYSTILSILCVILIIGYWTYGGRLIIIQFQVLRIKSQKLNRNLKNMTIVLLITSIALALQIIFLYLNAFSKRVTIALALVYYVVVELIPCIFLIYVFMRFGKKSKKKKNAMSGTTDETPSGETTESIRMSEISVQQQPPN